MRASNIPQTDRIISEGRGDFESHELRDDLTAFRLEEWVDVTMAEMLSEETAARCFDEYANTLDINTGELFAIDAMDL
jgi:hypothetical protein